MGIDYFANDSSVFESLFLLFFWWIIIEIQNSDDANISHAFKLEQREIKKINKNTHRKKSYKNENNIIYK